MARTTLRGKCGNQKWRWVGGVFLEKGQRDTIRITIDYGTEVGCGPIIVSKVCRRNEKYTRKNKATHKIRTLDIIPIRQKPYRIPQTYKKKVMEELEEMEKNEIIKKSESEWASPMAIVKKKDGGVRLCVDYRRLNAITKFDAYPMPRIEELSTIDLAKGYWQVPMSDEDREKTAFSSLNKLLIRLYLSYLYCAVPVR